jgi:hypothetical protein
MFFNRGFKEARRTCAAILFFIMHNRRDRQTKVIRYASCNLIQYQVHIIIIDNVFTFVVNDALQKITSMW